MLRLQAAHGGRASGVGIARHSLVVASGDEPLTVGTWTERATPSTPCAAIAFLLERAARADVPGPGVPRPRPTSSPTLPADELAARVGGRHAHRAARASARRPRRRSPAGRGRRGAGYLATLEAAADGPVARRRRRGAAGALRGDLHTHSDWSDGGSPIEEMARDRARPRARVRGADRPLAAADRRQRAVTASGCASQLDVVAELNERAGAVPDPHRHRGRHPRRRRARPGRPSCWPGSTSSSPRVHSKLRMDAADDDPPDGGRGRATRTPTSSATAPAGWSPAAGASRPESEFDAELVFEAVPRSSAWRSRSTRRPERLDPPRRLLRLAVETGCLFSHRHRRARARPARLAALRLRAGRGVRRAGRAGGQHLAGRRTCWPGRRPGRAPDRRRLRRCVGNYFGRTGSHEHC